MSKHQPVPAATAAAATTCVPTAINTSSRWQEPIEVPGLTLFDIYREPRQPAENARVRLPLKVR